MIHKFAEKSAEYFTFNGLIKESRYEWCIYAIEKRLTTLLATSFMLALGSLVYGWVNALAFLATFLIMRKNTGGYHADSNGICFILSNVIILAALQSVQWMEGLYQVQGIMLAASIFVLATLAPVNHPNMHFSKAELLTSKKKVLQKLGIAIVAIVICKLAFVGTAIYLSVLMGLITVSITVIIAKIIGQEVKTI